MKRIAVVAVLCAFSSCASTQVHLIPRKDLPPLYATPGTPDPSREQRVIVYMLQGNRLAAVARNGTSNLALPELVLRALFSGPNRNELSMGLQSAIPAAVELTDVTVTNGIADIDLNAAFKTAVREDFVRRVAQVVYTLDELDEVDSVRFFVEGRRLTVIDQNGNDRTDPVGRGSYSRYAPRAALGAPVSDGPLRLDMPGDEEAAVP